MGAERDRAIDGFVEAWGALGAIFGTNPSAGRVSALLMVTGETLSLGELADRLRISRGNASMCLKDLRAWGLVRRIARPGDRRDYYRSSENLWRMSVSLARERKRREFDPAVERALEALGELAGGEPEPKAAERVAALRDFLETLSALAGRLLENEEAVLSLVGLLRSGAARPGG